ncbi:serine protease inhibitor Kazal-type 1-like [Hippocampus comes]|uniref:serine protease inhibitor Kazal-type 1-like n=1 Tax=Hippocampus comes TaxID=109280 RepID=UPI00094F2C95|nr:PREDICTED: serine protease inhibitor Kazal-type 1-like [Hippocampus comes]
MAGNVLLVGLLLFCVIADTEAYPIETPCPVTHEPFICGQIYKPVCGTDQNTYSSMCTLCQHNQSAKIPVWIAHYGECFSAQQSGK